MVDELGVALVKVGIFCRVLLVDPANCPLPRTYRRPNGRNVFGIQLSMWKPRGSSDEIIAELNWGGKKCGK